MAQTFKMLRQVVVTVCVVAVPALLVLSPACEGTKAPAGTAGGADRADSGDAEHDSSDGLADSGADGDDAADAPDHDAIAEADGPDATAQPDGPEQCKMTVADYCAGPTCVMAWPADLAQFCKEAPNGLGGLPSYNESCGQYHALFIQGVDRQQRNYYDALTGKLVAIVTFDANSWVTWCAGPSVFDEPVCSGSPTPISCVNDASTD